MKLKKILITAVIVVAAFFVLKEIAFPKFNLLKALRIVTEKNVLKETSISIEKIEKIAKLTIAEYYGEVINSLFEENFKRLLTASNESYKNTYGRYRNFLKEHDNDRISNRDRLKKKLKKNDRELYDLFNIVDTFHNSIVDNTFPQTKEYIKANDYSQFYKTYKAAYLAKRKELFEKGYQEKSEIAYLARGKVILSFDLEKLSEKIKGHDVREKEMTLRLGLDLTIESIINPYFIYARNPYDKKHIIKYPGYMVLEDKHNRFNAKTMAKIKLVKEGCQAKLVQLAFIEELTGPRSTGTGGGEEKKTFLETAKDKAERTLTGFIKLFKQVTIKDKSYDIDEKTLKVSVDIDTFRYEGKEMNRAQFLAFLEGQGKRGTD